MRGSDAPAVGAVLLGSAPRLPPAWGIAPSSSEAELAAYRTLRRQVFVDEQGLFSDDRAGDTDAADADPRTVVLLAHSAGGTLLGGVRVHPATAGTDLGWWIGGRLVVRRHARGASGVGPALVRAACAYVEQVGGLRFDAQVQAAHAPLFARLGWLVVGEVSLRGRPHVAVRWPCGRLAAQARGTKSDLGALLAGLDLGGPGYVGDDGVAVPGSDVIAACDAIVPSMVERDPEWAGWCGVLVNVNDLAAMGAEPVGLLDAVAARDAAFAARVITGLRAASRAFGVPVLGGHTQLGAPAALSVTALGRTNSPVRAGGGQVGHEVRMTADLGGGWRPGYTGRQWDSTTHRSAEQLQHLTRVVARTAPAAAKDVSMAGTVGTLGMLAEASGCGAVLDVAALPRPAGVATVDWLSCFPGFAMLTTDVPGRAVTDPGPATSAVCGRLVAGAGVSLRWPDGVLTEVIAGGVTGLGPAGAAAAHRAITEEPEEPEASRSRT